MKNLKKFIYDFLHQKGQYVFVSLFLAKVCAFLGALFVIRVLPEAEFGKLTIVASMFAVFAPLNGLGSSQSLLRFGSISEGNDKDKLSKNLFWYGMKKQVLVNSAFLFSMLFFMPSYDGVAMFFVCFAIRLLGFYFYQHIQSHFRVIGENKKFASVNNVVNISGLIMIIVCTHFFAIKGYLLAIAIAPFMSLLYYKKHFFNKVRFASASAINKEVLTYGWHAAGTALLSDLLFSLDILLLGFLMNENAVAQYKVAILLPANVTFLSIVFIQTNFPMLAKVYQSKKQLKEYIKNYYRVFLPLVFVLMVLGYWGKEFILSLVFGEKYHHIVHLFILLWATFLLNILLRNLYGNLLSAVGLVKINTYVSIFSLFILVLLSFVLVPYFGILGMVMAMSVTLFLSGVLYAYHFMKYLRELK